VPSLRNAFDQLAVMARRALHGFLGRDAALLTEDRQVLERLVMPFFAADPRFARVLFVGCDWYTKHYEKTFAGREYWTLEKDASRARYGAARHVTDSLEHLSRHFAPGSLDLILCNGVLGWGLNELAEAERSFEACFACLRPGGVLVLGWNDVAHKRPFPLEECQALKRYAPFALPPLGASRHRVPGRLRHTFDFLARPA
jgi:SAM-dependent methyltransferase